MENEMLEYITEFNIVPDEVLSQWAEQWNEEYLQREEYYQYMDEYIDEELEMMSENCSLQEFLWWDSLLN